MSILVVTPARNEAVRLPLLAQSLAVQSKQTIGLWVVVDDGSTDGTAGCLPPDLPFPVEVLRRENGGGLAGGSAFAAWRDGAEHGLRLLPDAERVLKLDADVTLDPSYLEAIDSRTESLVAGVLSGPGELARVTHTRGALKGYDRQAYEVVARLPVAIGFDVMDEVALRLAGLSVAVEPSARAAVTRVTGTSEGRLKGRYRGGLVSRWTGYSRLYFAFRLLVHAVRRPMVLGSVAMLVGYLRAGDGPWPAELKTALRDTQRKRLKALVLRPRTSWAGYRRPR